MGGLGIRCIKGTNQALLGKWLWRYGEGLNLWAKVIASKYGSCNGHWDTEDKFRKPGRIIWRDVLCYKAKFVEGIKFRVYEGDKVRFWWDKWCTEDPLKDLFPQVFALARDKEVMVKECFSKIDSIVERNARIFKGCTKGTQYLFNKVIAITISWVKSLELFRFVSTYDLWHEWTEICTASTNNPNVVQAWSPAPQGILKLNFDGSSLGPAGIGGLLRDENGDVIWAFSGPIGVAGSNEVEVQAIYQGICFLQSEDLNRVEIEGDSLNVIRWVREKHLVLWRFAALFDEIQDRVGSSSISFNHIRRTANGEANKLARERVHMERVELFDFLPP
ncbi:uncharacterized protein LOC143869472 [Tasmannia lanceolata]|uniref:uncharacterized protein LOC143869469 n=1 Tax=Tasmannia lanceolata TaxID=3420 RepID=UPI0040633B34